MAYQGNVATIPLGQIGLLTDVPPGEVPRGALIKANNVSFETGMITKAPGSLRYNGERQLPSGIVGVFDWWPDINTQRMIAVTSDGKIYRDIGDGQFGYNVISAAFDTAAEGLGTLDPTVIFAEGGNETAGRNKKLFLFSDKFQVRVLSGDNLNFTTISQPAVDWGVGNYPVFGVNHRNRLWAFEGQRAYASDTGDHENFVSNNLTQNIFPGEGGEVIGAFVFKGRLFAFKEGSFVYYLDDSDIDSDNWNWKRLASNFGLASPNGIVEILNDMIAVNESGSPISYNAVDALGDIESADILRLTQIEDYFRNVTSLSGISVMHAIYYESKKQAFFTWRDSYRQTNNLIFHLDFNKPNPRPCFWSKDTADCLALRKDIHKVKRPIYGSSDGYVYLMDREDRLVGGSGYLGEFKTGHIDFRFMDEKMVPKNKLFDYLGVEFLPTGNWTIAVDVYIDGTFSETIEYNQDVRDDGLDDFTLDSDPLGREETQTVIKPLHGSGRRISFHVRQEGENENFALASLIIGFRISGEQATRV